MEQNHQTSKFKKLLDKLQQESWQLELLISGFAIFGLFSAIEPIEIRYDIAQNEDQLVETFLWYAARVCCWILISNLLIHVILRGLWIGALGLRYVSGDIDYDELKYSDKFTQFLQKKIGSFDKYIATLENYCSILFAVSFLFVFYFLACLLSLASILCIVFIFLDTEGDGIWQNISVFIGIALILFIILGAIFTFIDFITQGFLKKKKWTSKIYFPFYKVFSVITLSFLYRPLVYNFLDNRFGKILSWILIPIYISLIFFSAFTYETSNYLTKDSKSSSFYANSYNYEDHILKENDFVRVASIPSKVIKDNYLKVFIMYNERLEDGLFEFNKGLKPETDTRGLQTTVITFGDLTASYFKKRDSLKKQYLKTFNTVYTLKIDKKKFTSDFISTTNKFNKLGFETFLNIDSLSQGKHFLTILRKQIRKKDTLNYIAVEIPFWYYKQ